MTILFLINSPFGFYKFRRELAEELVKSHRVVISTPEGRMLDYFEQLGCEIDRCEALARHGTDPRQELRLYRYYRELLRRVKPDCVCTYTVKPNVYGGIACAKQGVPYLVNVTGLGESLEKSGAMKTVITGLYRRSLKHAKMIFFQNAENRAYLLRDGKLRLPNQLLPGSGINLEQHRLAEYPPLNEDDPLILSVVGRMVPDKGVREILSAAKDLKGEKVEIRLIGSCAEPLLGEIREAEQGGVIRYLGFQNDMETCYRESHAILHASYHEGMSNVLLEAAACGRPVLATDVPGCKETFVDGVSGLAFPPRDPAAIRDAILRFRSLPWEKKREMGLEGRRHVEAHFDRRLILNAYMKEISEISEHE